MNYLAQENFRVANRESPVVAVRVLGPDRKYWTYVLEDGREFVFEYGPPPLVMAFKRNTES